jgi:hypothetical protein
MIGTCDLIWMTEKNTDIGTSKAICGEQSNDGI